MCNDIKCKYCGSDRINKSGIVNSGNQRYLCRDCKKTFTITKRKYSEEYKLKIIKMYLENMGIRSIERLEGVSNVLILKWIRKFGKIIKEKIIKDANNIPDDLKKEDIEILEGDEIVTYVKKACPHESGEPKMVDKTSGYGFLLTETEIKLLIFK